MIALKKATIIRVEAEILKRAKELGINISQYCENALKAGITALENTQQKIAQNQTAFDKSGEARKPVGFSQAGPVGFEPTFSGSEGRRLDPYWATGPFC